MIFYLSNKQVYLKFNSSLNHKTVQQPKSRMPVRYKNNSNRKLINLLRILVHHPMDLEFIVRRLVMIHNSHPRNTHQLLTI